MGAEQALKRIPRIKFPQKHPKPSASGSISETQGTAKDGGIIDGFISRSRSRSDVPAPPINTAMGGKASLLPKRTPVSEREIEAILLICSILRLKKYSLVDEPTGTSCFSREWEKISYLELSDSNGFPSITSQLGGCF
ncbi:hypothetical protein DITRI_Ditri07aG0096100 [Diplodiscus trichospermus]